MSANDVMVGLGGSRRRNRFNFLWGDIYMLFNALIKKLKGKEVFMMIGNSGTQFRDMRKVKGLLTGVLKEIPIGAAFLYFGDPVDKPTVGLLIQMVKERRPDVGVFMIQIAEAKSWGVPDFVDGVYWHRDYSAGCKWGGIYKGEPCSNTKKWLSVHKRVGISKMFIFGGGKITLQESRLAKRNKIPVDYFPVERKFNEKGERITGRHSLKERIGVTYQKIE